jgi:NADH dehydrogenase
VERLRRTGEAPDAVEVRLGDVTDPASLAAAVVGVDAVVHLAAIARDRDGGASMRLVNTEGTRNVVVAMREAGVRRLVHLGALGVVDDPRMRFGSSKAKAVAIVRESGLDWTILEPSIQWGAGDGFFNLIAGLVRVPFPLVPVPGTGRARFQPIGTVDVARAVVLALSRPATIGQVFELGGPRVWTYRALVEEVARALGKRRWIVPMPVPLIALVAGAAERLRLPFPVATDQLRQLPLDNVAVDTDVVERAFGFRPADMAGRLGYLRWRIEDQGDPQSDGPEAGTNR